MALLILFFAMLTGCSTKHVIPAEQEIEISEYRIGNGDQLYINVWKNPDLSLSVPVRPDGKISVPLVGDANATGLTPQALATELTDKLNQYIRLPEVTVIVTSAASAEFLNRVRITGAIRTPQSIPYRQGMTVLDLVLLAGSLTEFANGNDAILYRKTSDGTKSYPVEIEKILEDGNLSTNYELRPSDILIVPGSIF